MTTYNCDWPHCTDDAASFLDEGITHRPLCGLHGRYTTEAGRAIRPIGEIDPEKVPRKNPTQAERAAAEGRPWPPSPLVPRFAPGPHSSAPPPAPSQTAPAPETPSRPPVKKAFADFAAAVFDVAHSKFERWRRGI